MEGALLNKARLRTEIRQRRREIEPALRLELDRALNLALVKLVEDNGSNSLSAFWPFDGEPDLRPALQNLSRRGIRIALPVVVDTSGALCLEFRAWHPAAPLKKNLFGIGEPGAAEAIQLRDLDLVLLPLVGWDEQGRRLGMGAGYYDRALADVADHPRPLRVGAAFELQKVDQVPTDPWDVRLHQVITENGRFTCTP